MKPQQRVVTAQDVGSSLYYFHVDSADDEEIREALQVSQEAKRLSGIGEDERRHSSENPGLKRKPLPMSPQLALGTRPEVPPKVYPHFQIPDYQPREPSKFARKPLPSPAQEPPVLDAIPQLPPRKPLGPRPLHLRNNSTETIESIAEYPAQNEGKQVSNEDRAPGFSITIIRRDPTSGGQWNVGKLTAKAAATQRKSSLGSSSLQTPQAENNVSIEISTKGYNRFIDYSTTLPTPEPTQDTQASSSDLDTPRSENFPSYLTKRRAFRRQLLLEMPRNHSLNQSPRQNGIRSGVDSRSSEWSAASEPPGQTSLMSPPPTPPLLRPWTFQSPWNGTCEFSTGVAGRILKCKHTLPSPANSAGQRTHSTYTVSELRFNLPGSKIFTKGPTAPKLPPLPTSNSKRSSFLLSSQAHNRSQSLYGRISEFRDSREEKVEESEDEFNDWMDLSLGREQAGGGMRGKQAKLGKLIVEDEGLKMLDLVVAANMGVWWGVWGWDLG
ncbi:hypothetical protein MMC30_003756 [Trapelia coarctata]|nr:hypothetical protein [Trapelia coarctata]